MERSTAVVAVVEEEEWEELVELREGLRWVWRGVGPAESVPGCRMDQTWSTTSRCVRVTSK